MRACMCVSVRACVRVYICVCMRVFACVCGRVYTHRYEDIEAVYVRREEKVYALEQLLDEKKQGFLKVCVGVGLYV